LKRKSKSNIKKECHIKKDLYEGRVIANRCRCKDLLSEHENMKKCKKCKCSKYMHRTVAEYRKAGIFD